MIIGVINGKNKILGQKNVMNKQINPLRVIGSEKLYSQIYFDMVTIYEIRSLTLNQEEKIKKECLRVSIKRTRAYHIAKIRILLRPDLKHGNLEWYESQLAKKSSYK